MRGARHAAQPRTRALEALSRGSLMKARHIHTLIAIGLALFSVARVSSGAQVVYAETVKSEAVEPGRYSLAALRSDLRWCGIDLPIAALSTCYMQYSSRIDALMAESLEWSAAIGIDTSEPTPADTKRAKAQCRRMRGASAEAEEALIACISEAIEEGADDQSRARVQSRVEALRALRLLDRSVDATRALCKLLYPDARVPRSTAADIRARFRSDSFSEPVRDSMLALMRRNATSSAGSWQRLFNQLTAAEGTTLVDQRAEGALVSSDVQSELQKLRALELGFSAELLKVLPPGPARDFERRRAFLLGVSVPQVQLPGPNGALLDPRDVVRVVLRQAHGSDVPIEGVRDNCRKWLADDNALLLEMMNAASGVGDNSPSGTVLDDFETRRQDLAHKYLSELARATNADWLVNPDEPMPAEDSLPVLTAEDAEIAGSMASRATGESASKDLDRSRMYTLPTPIRREAADELFDALGVQPAQLLIAQTAYADFIETWTAEVAPLANRFRTCYDEARAFPPDQLGGENHVAAIEQVADALPSRRAAWKRSDDLEEAFFSGLEGAFEGSSPEAVAILRAERLARMLDTVAAEAARSVPGRSRRPPNAARVALVAPNGIDGRSTFVTAAASVAPVALAAARESRESLFGLKDEHVASWAKSVRLELEFASGRISEQEKARRSSQIEAAAASRRSREDAAGSHAIDVVRAANRSIVDSLDPEEGRRLELWLAMDECFRSATATLAECASVGRRVSRESNDGLAARASHATAFNAMNDWLERNSSAIVKLQQLLNRRGRSETPRFNELNAPVGSLLFGSFQDAVALARLLIEQQSGSGRGAGPAASD